MYCNHGIFVTDTVGCPLCPGATASVAQIPQLVVLSRLDADAQAA
jgi:hypothetical protein